MRANILRPLEPPEAYKAVPRRVLGLDGQIAVRADNTSGGLGFSHHAQPGHARTSLRVPRPRSRH
jgi:hypothetical protein